MKRTPIPSGTFRGRALRMPLALENLVFHKDIPVTIGRLLPDVLRWMFGKP